MARLSDLSIRSKVLFAFSILFLVTVGLGGFALQRLNTVNTAAIDVRDNWLPSTVLVGQMAKTAERYRLVEARLLLAQNDEQKQTALSELPQFAAQVADLRKRYEPLITPGEERGIIEGADRAWLAYQEADRKTIAMAQAGDLAGAVALFNGEGRATFDAVRKGLNDDLDLNVREGRKSADVGAAAYDSAFWWILGVLAGSAVICVLVGLTVVNGIATPIQAITQAMRRLADRDLLVEIPGVGRKDEIGAMADTVSVFKTSMIEAERLTAEQLAAAETRARRAERLEQLTKTFEGNIARIVGTVSSSATQVKSASQKLSGTAVRTSEQATATASASEEASTNVQTVASATEELAASTNSISEQVGKAAQVANQACDEAQRTDVTVKGLASAAQKIGDVVNLIQDIASQTNLLALNATIEAARAGEAGKGFAVVAGEVKHLANQTAKATEEIRQQVEEMQTATREATQAIDGIVTTISNISEISTTIASAVEEQGAATQEIARNVEQAAAGTQDVSSSISQVNAAATETGAAAQQMQSAAEALNHEADSLRREVETFLSGVKAI